MKQHHDSGADVTLATILIPPEETYQFGVVDIDQRWTDHRIRGEAERPKLRSPYNSEMVSGSMGVYMFNTDVLIPVLLKDAEDPNSRARLRTRHPAEDGGRLQTVLVQLHRREQEGSAVLARRGDPGRLLRGEHGPGVGVPGIQPVRRAIGRCARTSGSIRRRSSCSPRRDAWELRSIR